MDMPDVIASAMPSSDNHPVIVLSRGVLREAKAIISERGKNQVMGWDRLGTHTPPYWETSVKYLKCHSLANRSLKFYPLWWNYGAVHS